MTEKTKKPVAMKFDQGKVMMSLFPKRAYLEVCKVLTFGAIGYAPGNWKEGDGFDWQRLMDGMERHYTAFSLGENFDKDSGLYTLAHHICMAAFLLEHQINGHGQDTRARGQIFSHDEIAMTLAPEVLERALEKKRKGLEAMAQGKAFQETK